MLYILSSHIVYKRGQCSGRLAVLCTRQLQRRGVEYKNICASNQRYLSAYRYANIIMKIVWRRLL